MQLMYKNENYSIFGNPETCQYDVVNNQTSFVEFSDKAYPKAQIVAMEYNNKIIANDKASEVSDATNVVRIR